MNAPEFQIPYTPDSDGKVLVAVHEMNRLIANDRMLKHLIERCTYLEDGRIAGKINEGDCWSADDADRNNLPLTSYLEIRVRGEHVPECWPIEMSLEQARQYSKWFNDGQDQKGEADEPEDRRDYERDARREEMEPMHYAGLLFPHQEPK